MATHTTLASATAAVKSNMDFESAGSVTKAQAFIDAANYLIAFRASSSARSGASMTFDVSSLERLMGRANSYIAANRTDVQANRFLSFEQFRT